MDRILYMMCTILCPPPPGAAGPVPSLSEGVLVVELPEGGGGGGGEDSFAKQGKNEGIELSFS